MKSEDSEKRSQREIDVKRFLFNKGWVSLGCFIFLSPSNTKHDLSAADLNQVNRIEKEQLFLV